MLYILIKKASRTPCCSHTTKCNVNSHICCILFTVRIHKSQSFQSYLVSMIHPFMLLLHHSVTPLVIWYQWCMFLCSLHSVIPLVIWFQPYIYIYIHTHTHSFMLLLHSVPPLAPSRSYWLVRARAAAPRLLYTVRPCVMSGRYFSTRCSQSHVPIIICIFQVSAKSVLTLQ